MESSFKLYLVDHGDDQTKVSGFYCYYGHESDAREILWDNSGECNLIEIEVEVKNVKNIGLSMQAFREHITNVDEDDVYSAWCDYTEAAKPFDEWWNETGKSSFSIDTDDAVAALKQLLGGS